MKPKPEIFKQALIILIPFGLFFITSQTFSVEGKRKSENLIAKHNSSSPQFDKNCTGCHGQRENEESLQAGIPTVHTTHRKQGLDCLECHKTVDLENGSAASIRRQVDIQLCVNCHQKDWFKGGES